MVAHPSLVLGSTPIALVNVSAVATSPSRVLFRALVERGSQVVPIRPGVAEIDGHPAFARLQDVPIQLGGAILMVAPRLVERYLDDCVEAGLSQVWVDHATPELHHAFKTLRISAISIDAILGHRSVGDTLRRLLHISP